MFKYHKRTGSLSEERTGVELVAMVSHHIMILKRQADFLQRK